MWCKKTLKRTMFNLVQTKEYHSIANILSSSNVHKSLHLLACIGFHKFTTLEEPFLRVIQVKIRSLQCWQQETKVVFWCFGEWPYQLSWIQQQLNLLDSWTPSNHGLVPYHGRKWGTTKVLLYIYNYIQCRYSYIKPVLNFLHWLPVKFRKDFKSYFIWI